LIITYALEIEFVSEDLIAVYALKLSLSYSSAAVLKCLVRLNAECLRRLTWGRGHAGNVSFLGHADKNSGSAAPVITYNTMMMRNEIPGNLPRGCAFCIQLTAFSVGCMV
jgi:hypothetical protein